MSASLYKNKNVFYRKLHTKHKSIDKANNFLLKKQKVQVFASLCKNKNVIFHRQLQTKHRSIDKANYFLLKQDYKNVKVFASHSKKVSSKAPGFRVACF